MYRRLAKTGTSTAAREKVGSSSNRKLREVPQSSVSPLHTGRCEYPSFTYNSVGVGPEGVSRLSRVSVRYRDVSCKEVSYHWSGFRVCAPKRLLYRVGLVRRHFVGGDTMSHTCNKRQIFTVSLESAHYVTPRKGKNLLPRSPYSVVFI